MRERNEVIILHKDDLERLAKTIAKLRIVNGFFIGDFHEQNVRWLPDGGIEIVTRYTEGEFDKTVEKIPTIRRRRRK